MHIQRHRKQEHDVQVSIHKNIVYQPCQRSETLSPSKQPNMSSSDTESLHKSLSDSSKGKERKPESLNKSLSDEGESQKPEAKETSTKEESSGKSTEKQPGKTPRERSSDWATALRKFKESLEVQRSDIQKSRAYVILEHIVSQAFNSVLVTINL